MITVKMVRDKGFKFVEGDLIKNWNDSATYTPNSGRSEVNLDNESYNNDVLISFTPRPNTSSMPCDGELLVDVEFNDGQSEIGKSIEIDWSIKGEHDDVKSWKPSFQNWTNEMNDNQQTQIETDTTNAQFESLGKSDVAEWKNGDACAYSGLPEVVHFFIGIHPTNDRCAVVLSEDGEFAQIAIDCLIKPETPQQREDRERLEATYDLYLQYKEKNELPVMAFESFKMNKGSEWRDGMLAIVDKTNYRVKGE